MAKRVVTGATRRARQMMVGGLALGHLVGIACLVLALQTSGRDAAFTVLLGFATVVLFFSIGQALEIIACELEPVQGMGLALASYVVRVVGITAGLYFILTLPAVQPRISDGWLLLSVTATVVAWITGVVVVAARQRVPIYDVDYVPDQSE